MVTLDATVVSSPSYVVVAGIAGVVRLTGEKFGVVGFVQGESERRPLALTEHATLERALVPDGASVPSGLPLLQARYVGFGLAGSVPLNALYRFSGEPGPVRAQIREGPGPFDCVLLGSPTLPDAVQEAGSDPAPKLVSAFAVAGAEDPAAAAGSATLTCAPPRTERLLVGSPAIVAVTTGEVRDALTLPVEAVAGLTDRGTVTLETVPAENREVVLGITDGTVVEIIAGLSEGDRVRVPAPDLQPR